jgi:hypothetical protein
MAAPDAIVELVEKFRSNEQEYIQPGFVEMRVREEFINPFFIALVWDNVRTGRRKDGVQTRSRVEYGPRLTWTYSMMSAYV